MNFELFIAKKHLMRRRKTTLISMVGVCVGVAALIVVLAVFTGFQSQLRATMVSVHPHLKIEKWGGMTDPDKEIEKVRSLHIPGLRTVAAFVTGEGLLQSETGATGVIVRGLDTERESLDFYKKNMVEGEFDLTDRVTTRTQRRFLFFKKTITHSTGGILIGEELAAILRLRVGDTVTLIAPDFSSHAASLAQLQSQTRSFIVKGIFHLGMSEFDSTYVLASVPQAQSMFRLGHSVRGLSLRFEDLSDALHWKWRLAGEYSAEYVITSWQDVNPNFFQALKVEKSVQTIFLSLIVLVAAFNIFSTLIMMVMEKTKDIGILKALGATAGSIRRIFLIQGFSIGFCGVLMGTGLGLVVLFYRNDILGFIKKTTGFELFPSDVYLFDGLPAEIHMEDITVIVAFALLASLLAGFYPAHRAAKLHPVEALRYE